MALIYEEYLAQHRYFCLANKTPRCHRLTTFVCLCVKCSFRIMGTSNILWIGKPSLRGVP